MKVSIKDCSIVKPSKPTWEGIFPLAEWDQVGTITHVPTVHFYKPSEVNSIVDTLKNSLSHLLVYFYHIAGRVRWLGHGRLELICNNMGVEFYEAECDAQLSDLGDFVSHTKKFKSLVPLVNYKKPIHEIPLILVQVTMFGCGGVSLGITMSHIVLDGRSAFHFLMDWAKLARGEPLDAPIYFDRKMIQVQEPVSTNVASNEANGEHNPPLLLGQENDLEEREKEASVLVVPLSREYVECLKKEANVYGTKDRGTRPYTRYEVVAAHIWRSACKARTLQSEQLSGLCITIDARSRLNPPLPSRFFGNAILDMVTLAKAGDIMTKPLSYTCGKIRESIDKVNQEYIWSNINLLKNLHDLSTYQDLNEVKIGNTRFYGNPNIGIISWLNLPIYGLDFGWGKEIYMGPGSHDMDGGCLVLPGPSNDGSVRVFLCLQVAHVDSFKKYFYEDINCVKDINEMNGGLSV